MELDDQDIATFREYCRCVVLSKSGTHEWYEKFLSTLLAKNSQVRVIEEITLADFECIYRCIESTALSKKVILVHFARFINELYKPIVSGSVIEMFFCNFIMLRNFLSSKHDQDIQLAFATFATTLLRRKEHDTRFLTATRTNITNFAQWCIATFPRCAPLMIACCSLFSIYFTAPEHAEDDAKLESVLEQLSSATASCESLCEWMREFRSLWQRLHLLPCLDSSPIIELLDMYRDDPDVSRAANEAIAHTTNCSFVDPSSAILHVISRACDAADGPLLNEIARTLLEPEMQDICIGIWCEYAEKLFSLCTTWSAVTPRGTHPSKSPFVGGTGILRALLSACPEQRLEHRKMRFALACQWIDEHNDDDEIYNALFIVLYLKNSGTENEYSETIVNKKDNLRGNEILPANNRLEESVAVVLREKERNKSTSEMEQSIIESKDDVDVDSQKTILQKSLKRKRPDNHDENKLARK